MRRLVLNIIVRHPKKPALRGAVLWIPLATASTLSVASTLLVASALSVFPFGGAATSVGSFATSDTSATPVVLTASAPTLCPVLRGGSADKGRAQLRTRRADSAGFGRRLLGCDRVQQRGRRLCALALDEEAP